MNTSRPAVTRSRFVSLRPSLLVLAALSIAALSFSAQSVSAYAEMPAVGQAPEREPARQLIPSFYVRGVTGAFMNRSVCYVCRHGERPVIMVVLYSTHPRLRMLLRNIDRVVDEHRADGLKSFGVYAPEHSERPISDIQTFAFNGRIQTPLSIASAGTLPAILNPPVEECVATVFLYERRQIRKRFDLGGADLEIERLEEIVDQIQAFSEGR